VHELNFTYGVKTSVACFVECYLSFVFMAGLPAILFLVYRRPEPTRRVLDRIRAARPEILLVAADAPKNEAERAAVTEVRRLIETGIDWPCRVEIRCAERHAGCRLAVSGAIDWAFERQERLIILEDDCLPEPGFFSFCAEMLERYAEAPEVAQICGSNLTQWEPKDGSSYFFSRFGPVWGWATWRRAWKAYDVSMQSWPEFRGRPLQRLCPEPFEADWRREVFDEVYGKQLDTWDYQWAYAKLITSGLNVIPKRHLVANIGFGGDATHTHATDDPRSRIHTHDLEFPLLHPAEIEGSREADRIYLQKVVGLPSSKWSAAGLKYLLKSKARRLRAWATP
jgi:hypothetical protein